MAQVLFSRYHTDDMLMKTAERRSSILELNKLLSVFISNTNIHRSCKRIVNHILQPFNQGAEQTLFGSNLHKIVRD